MSLRAIHSALTPRRQRSATSPRSRAVLSTRTQPALRKALPDQALIHTTRESSIRIDDGITGLDEVGVARLTA